MVTGSDNSIHEDRPAVLSEDKTPQTVTRKGRQQRFLSPNHVQLHCHDFQWKDLDKYYQLQEQSQLSANGSSSDHVDHMQQHAEGSSRDKQLRELHDRIFVTHSIEKSNVASPVNCNSSHENAVSSGHPSVSHVCGIEGEMLETQHQHQMMEKKRRKRKQSENSSSPTEAWEQHYASNQNHFFPIKNYIFAAFPGLFQRAFNTQFPSEQETNGEKTFSATQFSVLDAGCGAGSVCLPLMKYVIDTRKSEPHQITPRPVAFICFDISPTALRLLAGHPMVQEFISVQTPNNALNTGHRGASRNCIQRAVTVFPCDLSQAILQPPPVTPSKRFRSPNRDLDSNDPCVVRSASPEQKGLPVVEPPFRALVRYGGLMDRVLLIFVLGALGERAERLAALRWLRYCMKPNGGTLCFRDYGRHDHAERRFLHHAKSHRTANIASKVSPRQGDFQNTIFKADGTCQHFFEQHDTLKLFKDAGLVPITAVSIIETDVDVNEQHVTLPVGSGDKNKVLESLQLQYHCNTVINRKTEQYMAKVFVNGAFVRDDSELSGNV